MAMVHAYVSTCAGQGMVMMINSSQVAKTRPAQVAYSDTAHATAVFVNRAWARAWVVWGGIRVGRCTTKRQSRTCEWTRVVARSTAVAVRAAWRRRSMALVWRSGVGVVWQGATHPITTGSPTGQHTASEVAHKAAFEEKRTWVDPQLRP